MSFSSLICDKSVPEWTHNNIDYDKIGQIIISHKDDKQLLIHTFNEQLEIVNIFLSLKIKEISTKILSIESSIIKFSQDQQEILDKNSSILRRKLKMIKNHTSKYSRELEKLSRYIILQRIAVKQLFQKISNNYDCESSKKLINDIKSLPMFESGYENFSFNNIDLDPYFWELSLIFDVINDFTTKLNFNDSNTDNDNKDNDLSLAKRNSTDLFIKEASYRAQSSQQNENDRSTSIKVTKAEPISSIVDYDRIFLGETENLQRFLISKEDVEEFKFMLLTNSFQLFDEDIIFTTKNIVDTTTNGIISTNDGNLEQRATNANISMESKPSIKSLRSFRDITKFRSQSLLTVNPLKNIDFDTLNNNSDLQASNNNTKIKREDDIQYQLLFNSVDAGNTSEGKNILNGDQINQFPDMIMTNKNIGRSAVMCHIGGIRDHCITTSINQNMIDKIMSTTNEVCTLSTSNVSYTEHHIKRLIIDWINSHNLKPVNPTIDFKRLRLISYHQNNIYMLTISNDIVINENLTLPYSIFELRCTQKRRSSKFLDKLYSSIINKKLNCYPLPNELTLWKIALELYYLQRSSKKDLFTLVLKDLYKIDEDHHLTEEEFFNLGKSSLVELCSKEVQSEYANDLTISERKDNNNTSHNNLELLKISQMKVLNPKRKLVRYWNEFDDADENSEFYNQMFYINGDGDDTSSLSYSRYDAGFIKFDKSFIDDLYDKCQRIQSMLTFSKPKEKLLDDFRERYGSIAASNDDLERLMQLELNKINNIESSYEVRHDEIISLLYMAALLASTIITSITISIIIVLFKEKSQNVEVSHETILIVSIIFTLVIALVLIIVSLLLLFSRFTLAPTWHYVTSFVLFTTITISVCYGIIEIYF